MFTDSIVLNNRSIDLLFNFANGKGGSGVGGVKKLVIFCRCEGCIITNVKRVMVLDASITVK